MEEEYFEITVQPSGKKVLLKKSNTLTKENVMDKMNEALINKKICLKTMLCLSLFMDFAISTKDLEVIDKVYQRIDQFYFEKFS